MHQNVQKELLMQFCEKKGHCAIDDSTYEACASFLFYTSWFEELLFNYGHRQGPENNKKICQDLYKLIDFSAYNSYGDYFSERYLTESGTSSYFHNLRLRRDDARQVEHSLRQHKTNHTHSWELLWSYLMISYRFRNNMFHGSKGLIHLGSYVNQFCVINQFMRQLIGDIIDKNYAGYNKPRR